MGCWEGEVVIDRSVAVLSRNSQKSACHSPHFLCVESVGQAFVILSRIVGRRGAAGE